MIKDNFSILNLFLDKTVKIIINDNKSFNVVVPTIKEFSLNEVVNINYHIWTQSTKEISKKFGSDVTSSFKLINMVLFHLGIYQEYSMVKESFKSGLKYFLPDLQIDYAHKQIIIGDVILTEEIWEYILYILKLSCGEKVEKPLTFTSEEARKQYLAQKEIEEKIKRIKEQNKTLTDSDNLLKIFLTIVYEFPSFTIDYLSSQTMAQILWLQEYAAGSVSYKVNAKAFAAGNMKKGSKLDFFIK